MAYTYKPNKYVKYDDTLTFEENYKNGAVITKEKLDKLEQQVKENSAEIAVGEVKFVSKLKDGNVTIDFNEAEGTKRFNFAIPASLNPGKSDYLKHRLLFDKVEIDEVPENTIVNYFQDEVRVAVPSNTVWSANKDGKACMRAIMFAPTDAIYFKNALGKSIPEDASFHGFENYELAGVDDEECKFAICWLPLAEKDENDQFVYNGTKSNVEDGFYGWYWTCEWYNENKKLIGKSCIKITCVTVDNICYEMPYYMTNYYTKDEVNSLRRTEPYVDDNGDVFACGTAIIIDTDQEDSSKNNITWFTGNGKIKSISVDKGHNIYGGSGETKTDVTMTYPSSSITLNGGIVNNIYGGGAGSCDIGVSTTVINGGTITGSIYGAGYVGSKNNKIGYAHIILNNCDGAPKVYGGAEGYGSVGEVLIEVNGGTYSRITSGGVNSYNQISKVVINGGTIGVLHGCEFGTINDLTFEINGGTITNMLVWSEGGELDSNYPKIQTARIKIHGGTITTLESGINFVSDKIITGEYVDGVIANQDAALVEIPNLTKVYTHAQLITMMQQAINVRTFLD